MLSSRCEYIIRVLWIGLWTRGPWTTYSPEKLVPINIHICTKLCTITLMKSLSPFESSMILYLLNKDKNWATSRSEEGFNSYSVDVFSHFVIISPKKDVALHLNRLEVIILHLKMLCSKFGWSYPSGSREED